MEKLLEEHLLTEDEEFVKEYRENPPQIQHKLQYQPNEAIISKLDKEDLIQLGSRYLNNFAVYLKNILHLLVRTEKELKWLLESNGVDVDKKFKDDAKAQLELMEKQIEESKKALKEYTKN